MKIDTASVHIWHKICFLNHFSHEVDDRAVPHFNKRYTDQTSYFPMEKQRDIDGAREIAMGEKRKLQRFGLCLKGTVVATERRQSLSAGVTVFTRDISSGGAFFTTCKPFPVGTPVKVNLLMALAARFPRLATRPFLHVTGTVVRTDTNGMAVSFKNNHRFSAMVLDPILVAPQRFTAMANA